MNLSRNALRKTGDYIMNQGRPLEQKIFQYYFLDGNSKAVLDELKKYQNSDGGFGHGLEPDAMLPKSSPFQTSYGLSHLLKFDQYDDAKEMIKLAIHYLENIFSEKRVGWYSFSKDVNDYPHTPWWEYNEKEGMTAIDHNYGNPTAEIIGYLLRYQTYVKKLNVDDLVTYVLNYIENVDLFTSEHEIYCFIRLYNELKVEKKNKLEQKLIKSIEQLVEYNQEKWITTYVPQPLHFIMNKEMNYLGIDKKEIENNLSFLVEELEENTILLPPWGDSFYNNEFKQSYHAWITIKTLQSLLILREFDRID